MGLFDFLRKKTVRYAAIIALVGTLASACRKNLPEEKAVPISALAAQIQEDLRRGTPDQKKIKSFVRMAAQARKEYGTKVAVPKNLDDAVRLLVLFYRNYDDSQEMIKGGRDYRWAVRASSLIGFMELELERAERILGFRLDTERQDLIHHIGDVIAVLEKQISSEASTTPIKVAQLKIEGGKLKGGDGKISNTQILGRLKQDLADLGNK